MNKKSHINALDTTRAEIEKLDALLNKKILQVAATSAKLSNEEMEAVHAAVAIARTPPKQLKGMNRTHTRIMRDLEKYTLMHDYMLNHLKWKASGRPLNSKPSVEVSDLIPQSLAWTELDYERAARRLCQKIMTDEQREMFRRIWIHEFLDSPTPDDLESLNE